MTLFNKILLRGVLFAAFGLWGALLFGKLTFVEAPLLLEEDLLPREMLLRGEYTCLPHRDSDGPQTLECALGLYADDGNNYGLSFEQTDAMGFATGERIEVIGLVVPLEAISNDWWFKYDVVGIMQVDSFKKL